MPVEENGSGPLPEVPKISDSVKEQVAEKLDLTNKLDAIFGNESEESEPQGADTAEEKPAATPAEEPADEEVSAEAETPASEEDAAQSDEPAAAAAPAKSTAPTLPAAYRRTLEWAEWSKEEIDALSANPEQLATFLPTITKLHQTRNKEIASWAEAGRKAKEQQAPQQAATTQQQPAATAPSGLVPIDAAALKAQYGDEALIDHIVGPINATIARLNEIMPTVQQTQQRAAMSQAEMLGRQIDSFFSAKELAPYQKTYGTATATLTPEQSASRWKVLEYADYLVGGAAQNGRQIGFEEAMQIAFDAVSGPGKEQAVRQKIVTAAKARNKGISLKPGSRGSNLSPGMGNDRAKTRSDLEKRVNGGLRAVLG